jgi:hypothetical protein
LGYQTALNMRFPTVLFAVALIAAQLNAQVTVAWNQFVQGLSIALDQDNNVFTVNYDANLGGDITLIKRDSDGQELWQAAYDQTSTTRFDRATWVATDQLGNAIVTGTVMSGFSNPVNANSLVMKFDPDGELLWRAEYENDFDGSSTRKCLVDKANRIYVVGLGMGPNGLVTHVKQFMPDGTPGWSWFDAIGIGAPINIKFTPDSNLVISARSITGILNGYAKIDRQGNSLWSLTGVTSQTVGDAAGDADGNTYCVHGTTGGSMIKKLSPTGALLWESPYAITAYRVEVGSDGAPVVSGFPFNGTGGSAFLKADPDGAQLWLNADADGPNNFLLHAQMMLDAQNNAYLCAGTLFAMGICKVNADGSSAWHITAGNGNSQGFALGTDGGVYVVGGSTLKLEQDIINSVEGLRAGASDAPLVYPVPARDHLFSTWEGHVISTWRLFSTGGALLAEGRRTEGPLDVKRFTDGPLLLELVDELGEKAVVRLVKIHE